MNDYSFSEKFLISNYTESMNFVIMVKILKESSI